MKPNETFHCIKEIQGIKFVSLQFDSNIRNSTIGCNESKVICTAFKFAYRRKLPILTFVLSANSKINFSYKEAY